MILPIYAVGNTMAGAVPLGTVPQCRCILKQSVIDIHSCELAVELERLPIFPGRRAVIALVSTAMGDTAPK